MPTIKLLRNGQLTLPVKFRKTLGLKRGELLVAELQGDKIVLKPVRTVEEDEIRKITKEKVFELIGKNWEKNKDLDQKKVDRIVDETVREVREKRKLSR